MGLENGQNLVGRLLWVAPYVWSDFVSNTTGVKCVVNEQDPINMNGSRYILLVIGP